MINKVLAFAATNQDMKIEFINVKSDGDAIYIKIPSGMDILIYTGFTGNEEMLVEQLLKQEKNTDLEYVVLV